jgi:hypothetical protein
MLNRVVRCLNDSPRMDIGRNVKDRSDGGREGMIIFRSCCRRAE